MSSGTVQKIRTFKADLEAARARSGAQPSPETEVAPPKDTSTTIGPRTSTNVPPVPPNPETKTPESVEPSTPPVTPAAIPQPEPVEPASPEKPETNAAPKISTTDNEFERQFAEDAPQATITPLYSTETNISTEPPEPTPPIDIPSVPDAKENLPHDIDELSSEKPRDSLSDDVSGGTIVSNKRIGHYSLWRALKDNINSWRTRRKQKIAAKEAAKPKVSSAESRIDTLKEAAKGSYRAPQSDHGILLKQLKQREPQEMPKSNIVVKEKSDVPAPHWEHVIDEATPTDDETKAKEIVSEVPPVPPTPETTPAQVEEIKEQQSARRLSVQADTESEVQPEEAAPTPAATATQVTDTPPVKETIPSEQFKAPVEKEKEVSPTTQIETTEQQAPQPSQPEEENDATYRRPISVYQWPRHDPAASADVAKKVEDTRTAEETRPKQAIPASAQPEPTPEATQPEKKSEPVEPDKTSEPAAKPESAPREETAPVANLVRPVLIGLVIVLCVGAVGGGVWYFVNQPETAPTTTSTPGQQLLVGDADHLVSITENTDTIFSTIYNHMVESRNLTTHTFITGSNTTADPQAVASALDLRLPGNFARALTAITIGSLDGTEPFIILRATNFDTAFAGMLKWEQSLSIDVAPLFGEPVTESFDPNARTDKQLRSAFYADAVVANTSVRLLRDENNASRIIYGFADPNTIIITTNEVAYKQLLTRLRQQR